MKDRWKSEDVPVSLVARRIDLQIQARKRTARICEERLHFKAVADRLQTENSRLLAFISWLGVGDFEKDGDGYLVRWDKPVPGAGSSTLRAQVVEGEAEIAALQQEVEELKRRIANNTPAPWPEDAP